MPVGARSHRILLSLAVMVSLVGAAAAHGSTYSYDGTTQVLTVDAATNEVLHLGTDGAAGRYTISTSGAWRWSGERSAPGGILIAGQSMGLQTSGHDLGGATLAVTRLDITDSGPNVRLVIEGGDDGSGNTVPYADPINVVLDETSSHAQIHDVSGLSARPISFGTTSVSVQAPAISLDDDIVAAQSISPSTTSGSISLGGSAGTTRALVASGVVRTDPIVGAGRSLQVEGIWYSHGASGSPNITEFGTTRLTGDLQASTRIQLAGVEVSGTITRVLTAPDVTVLGDVRGGFNSCGSSDVTACDVGTRGTPFADVKVVGNLTAIGQWSDVPGIWVTGTTAMSADMASTGVVRFDGAVDMNGGPTRTITGEGVVTSGGIRATPAGGGACGLDVVRLCDVAVDTQHLKIVGNWATTGTAYVPGSITVTGRTVMDGLATISSDGPVNLMDALSVSVDGGYVQGAPVTIAGVGTAPAAGSIGSAGLCTPGPLTVIGDLHLTGPVTCLDTLQVSQGGATIDADVATRSHQGYDGPVNVDVGDGPVRMQSTDGALILFHSGAVSESWAPADGDIEGYTATIQPSGQSCSWTDGPLTCSFGEVAPASDLTFGVTHTLRAGLPPEPPDSPSGSAGESLGGTPTHRRHVARGSRTPLTRLLVPPASRGHRTWSETGPCHIRRGRLVAPWHSGSCTVRLRVGRWHRVPAWTGRTTVTIR